MDELDSSPRQSLPQPANAMWRKLLYSGFETWFGPSTQGAGIRYQNTSQIQILLASHFEKKWRDVIMCDWLALCHQGILGLYI